MKTDIDHRRINEAKWDKWARSMDGSGWPHSQLRRMQEAVVSFIDIKENISFLDVGCGTGKAVGQAAALARGKGLFYGVDLSARMIEKAQENFKGSDAVHFIRADVGSIPLDSGFFDAIICTNSFHHYLHPCGALKEIYRLLKRGGKLYLLDPTADSWFIRLIDTIGKLVEPAHVRLYSTEEFKKLFADAGLSYSSCPLPSTRQKVHIGEKIIPLGCILKSGEP